MTTKGVATKSTSGDAQSGSDPLDIATSRSVIVQTTDTTIGSARDGTFSPSTSHTPDVTPCKGLSLGNQEGLWSVVDSNKPKQHNKHNQPKGKLSNTKESHKRAKPEDHEDDEERSNPQKKKDEKETPKGNYKDQDELEDPQKQDTNKQQDKPPRRPPPIIFNSIGDFKEAAKTLKNSITDISLIFTRNGGKIQTKLAEDHEASIKQLKENNIPHHTYQNGTRNAKMVLRGMHAIIDAEEIKELLETEDITANAVTQMKRNIEENGNRKQIPMPLYIIEVAPDQANKLKHLTGLSGYKIKIEPYRQDKKPLQCYKCQKFGHHSGGCGNKEVCVHCAGNHHSKECTAQQEGRQKKCANCGGSHEAKDTGCETWITENNKIKQKQEKQQTRQTAKTHLQDFPELKGRWADPVKNNEEATRNANDRKQFNEAVEFIQSRDFKEAIANILRIKKKIETIKSPKQRQAMITLEIMTTVMPYLPETTTTKRTNTTEDKEEMIIDIENSDDSEEEEDNANSDIEEADIGDNCDNQETDNDE